MDRQKSPTLDERLAQLGKIQSALAHQLPSILELPLEQAFSRLLKQPDTRTTQGFVNTFSDHLDEYLEINGRKNNALCDAIIQCPVIQQADHSGILLDNEIFLNNLFFSMALSSDHSAYGVTVQCSTVKCISARAPLKGPLFLSDGSCTVRLSDMTNSQLKSRSFCNLPSPFHLSMSGFPRQQGARWKRLSEMWNAKVFACAEDAFISINTVLGEQIKKHAGAEIVFLDERFTSFLAAKQLLNAQFPIADMVFDKALRALVLDVRKATIESPDNFVLGHDLTDFFYFKGEQKLEFLSLENCAISGELILKRRSDGEVLAQVGRRGLARMLEDGKLYCDRFIGYFVRCFCSGMKALGGTSQQDSVAFYRTILRTANTQLPFMGTAIENVCFREELTFLAGAPFFESVELDHIDALHAPGTDHLGQFVESIKTSPVRQLVGQLQSCNYLLDNAIKHKGR
ncbi:hypothetical protein [Pseudomonas sp. UBA6562]|uniref:hypothetical protein n=1 Tax=Pseudomonas sp. UBA6562 TaxID=1947332 RepID=UPI0025D18B69|nr:hypothetical protein [Pseudomonas sp. UBA6562]